MGWPRMLFLTNVLLTLWFSPAKGEVNTCDFPQINNGHLYYEETRRPYFPVPIGKQFSYYCDSGFGLPSGYSWDYMKCTEDGWEPAVPCLRQCVFHDVENGESPYWQRTYVQDESVKVKCHSGYSLPNGQDTILCTENGWSPQPKCISVMKTCDFPQIKNGHLYYEEIRRPYFPVPIGKQFSYYCDSGFGLPSGYSWDYMKCTEDGWEPAVPCLRQCVFHDVENGESPYWQRTYVQDQSVKVKCHSGYSLPNGLDTISCTENGWSTQPKCIRINSTKACGPPPPIDNGDITSFPLSVYAPSSSVEYQCQSLYQLQGNKTVTCRNGEWSEKPKCLLKTCDFPQINNGHLYYEETRRPYFPVPIGKQFSYYCDSGFGLPSGYSWDYMKCTKDGWEPAVPCLRQCVLHDVENGESPYWQRTYVQDQSVKVKCHSDYSLPNGLDTISCTENGWSPQPKCIRMNSCERPVFENARTENNSTWFKLNDKLDYECNDGYENKHKHTKDSITCNFDGWSDIPSCFDSTKACGPPPPIDNGDITSFPLSVYAPSSSVEYQCQSLYQLQGNKTITCRNGEWSQKPKCLRPCTVSEEILEKHNIIFKWAEKQKRYYESGSMQEFKCKNGYHLATSQPLLTICIDGHINYPTCTKSH